MGSGDQTLALMFATQTLCPLSHLPGQLLVFGNEKWGLLVLVDAGELLKKKGFHRKVGDVDTGAHKLGETATSVMKK